jgi:hypothetical protein
MNSWLEQLVLEAEEVCKFRGHELKEWTVKGTKAFTECKNCSMTVTCNSDPLPNQTDIVGEAVAIHCGGKGI